MKKGQKIQRNAGRRAAKAKRPKRPLASSADAPVLQRKAGSCACGGGCPRCSSVAGSGSGAVVQPKLKIGPADDAFEREADRVADHVVSDRAPDNQAAHGGLAKDITPLVQRQPMEEEEEELQAKRESGDTPLLQRQAAEEEEEELQAKPEGAAPAEPTADAANRLSSMRGRGEPLSDELRAYFEPRFGRDFSAVRVHRDGNADRLAGDLGARAFTAGADVVFRGGAYRPQSREGRRLFAHELAHVVQQGAAPDATSGRKTNTAAPGAGGVVQRASDEKLPQKKVTVNITHLKGGAVAHGRHIRKANRVFKQARVKVEKGKVERIGRKKSKEILGDDLVLEEFTSASSPTDEEKELLKHNRTTGRITMYYVGEMSDGSLGEAFDPSSGQPVSFVYASDNSRTWPHELGHVLLDEGGHPADDDNFMAQTATATGKEEMTEDQIKTIRSSAFVS